MSVTWMIINNFNSQAAQRRREEEEKKKKESANQAEKPIDYYSHVDAIEKKALAEKAALSGQASVKPPVQNAGIPDTEVCILVGLFVGIVVLMGLIALLKKKG